MYNLKSCKRKLQAFILKVVGHKNDIANEAKTSSKEVITDVVAAAQQILKELDLLATELEQKPSSNQVGLRLVCRDHLERKSASIG